MTYKLEIIDYSFNQTTNFGLRDLSILLTNLQSHEIFNTLTLEGEKLHLQKKSK